jgi:chitinase
VSAIPWSKYTHIIHEEAWANSDGSLSDFGIAAEAQQMNASKPAGKKLLISILDSQSGDTAAFANATSPSTIATFVNNIVNYVAANSYDGVDLDWEANVNVTQYENLVTRLRAALPGKVITMTALIGDPATAAGVVQSLVDQVNVMCYYMGNSPYGSWYNDAVISNLPNYNGCDVTTQYVVNAGVPAYKIGVGIPYYGYRWSGCTKAMMSGCTNTGYFIYRDLVTDTTRWQPQYQYYDTQFKSNYLSIPSLNEFDSYNGPQFITDVVAWAKSKGYGGYMTYGQTDEYL